ncbi:MAG: hypothetical protein ACPG5B_08530 [Chitinophagales bacterium]
MFEHLFKTEEELEKLTPKERASYQYNLKYYRDLKNVTDTARNKGKIEVTKNLKVMELPIEQIMQATGLSRAEIENL